MTEMVDTVGSVRIRKADSRNYCVEQFQEIESRIKGKKTGETRQEWVEVGYYGSRLESAVHSALMSAVPEGAELLGEFEKASKAIIAAMEKL